jgi:hypothetical protein
VVETDFVYRNGQFNSRPPNERSSWWPVGSCCSYFNWKDRMWGQYDVPVETRIGGDITKCVIKCRQYYAVVLTEA